MALLFRPRFPYVNASPHIGFALELVLADVIARHARTDCWFMSPAR